MHCTRKFVKIFFRNFYLIVFIFGLFDVFDVFDVFVFGSLKELTLLLKHQVLESQVK